MRILTGIGMILITLLIFVIVMSFIEVIIDKIHENNMPNNLSPRDEWRWKNGGID